jgi:mRNA interferase RelE/StbE
MITVLYSKKFLKDLASVPAKQRQEIEDFVFETLPNAKSIAELHKFEKMKGYSECYKARFGSYRIGAIINDDGIELKRLMDRKNIYKFFP